MLYRGTIKGILCVSVAFATFLMLPPHAHAVLPSNWSEVDEDSDITSIEVSEIPDITCANVQDLPYQYTSGFTPAQIPSLSTAVIACFSYQHIGDFDVEDIDAMTQTQLGYIDWEGGGTRPIAGLTQAQVAAIDNDKFDGFSYEQLFWFPVSAISGITSDHIDNMVVSAGAFRDWQMTYFTHRPSPALIKHRSVS